MAASQTALVATSLILRLKTLIFLVASLAVIATAKFYGDPDYFVDYFVDDDGDVVGPHYVTFQDYYAYRYVLSSGVIGCAYTLLVIPFLVINVARRKMAGGSEGGTIFLIFADLVFSVLIATGAAAGLGLAVEYQRYEKFFDSDQKKFFHSVDASCGLLLVATVCMVIMVMISVYSLTK